MIFETKNNEYETDGKTPGRTLPDWSLGYCSEPDVEALADHLTHESGWLIKSFDYRYDDGEWNHYHDDLEWRKTMRAEYPGVYPALS